MERVRAKEIICRPREAVCHQDALSLGDTWALIYVHWDFFEVTRFLRHDFGVGNPPFWNIK